MPKLSLLAAVIISTMPTGYRRAGLAFDKGENQYEINETQLGQIEQDANLRVASVKPIEPSLKKSSQENVDAPDEVGGLDSVSLDLSTVPELLAPFIACIHNLATTAPLAKKPKCDQLFTYDDDKGSEILRTASAIERDAAWAWYQENVVKVNVEQATT